MTALAAYVDGIGLLGPGLTGWPAGARVLTGEAEWLHAPTLLPPVQCLPSAERRRTAAIVRLRVAAGLEATAHAGVHAPQLPALFSSSGGDVENCQEIRQILATAE